MQKVEHHISNTRNGKNIELVKYTKLYVAKK